MAVDRPDRRARTRRKSSRDALMIMGDMRIGAHFDCFLSHEWDRSVRNVEGTSQMFRPSKYEGN